MVFDGPILWEEVKGTRIDSDSKMRTYRMCVPKGWLIAVGIVDGTMVNAFMPISTTFVEDFGWRWENSGKPWLEQLAKIKAETPEPRSYGVRERE